MSVLRRPTRSARRGSAQSRRDSRRPDTAGALHHHHDFADQHWAVPGAIVESAFGTAELGREPSRSNDGGAMVALHPRWFPARRDSAPPDELLGAVRSGSGSGADFRDQPADCVLLRVVDNRLLDQLASGHARLGWFLGWNLRIDR